MKLEKEYIEKIFNIIKDSFDEFKDLPIKLEIKDTPELIKSKSHAMGSFNLFIQKKFNNKIREIKIITVNDFMCIKEINNEYFQRIIKNKSPLFSVIHENINNENLLLYILLHEFGHLHQVLIFMNNSNSKIAGRILFDDYNFAAINLMKHGFNTINYRKTKNIDNKRGLIYKMTPTELYAELFVYKNFTYILNKIREENI
jgi:hypothetical protein